MKRSYAKKEDIPQEFLALYEERDGKWVLKVEIEGLVPKEKIDEFRTNNIALQKQLDDLKKQFEGIDPEAAKKAVEEARKKEEAVLIKEGKIEELLTKRTEAMRADYDKKLKDLQTAQQKAEAELAKIVIEKGLAEAAAKGKVLSSAVDDVVMRGRGIFKMQEGKAVALNADGTAIFGKDGKPLTIEEWVGQLPASAPHLFEPTSGSGARGAGSGGGGARKNPWSKEHFNLTEQGKLVRENLPEAKRLAAEAGKSITA